MDLPDQPNDPSGPSVMDGASTPALSSTSTIVTVDGYKKLPELEVEIPPGSQFTTGVNEKELLAFRPFRNWLDTLNATFEQHENNGDGPYQLKRITIQCVDQNKRGNIGFVKLLAPVTNMKGEKIGKPYVFLRGGSVAMLVILQDANHPDDKQVLLTVQPRIPAGILQMLELPAGKIEDSPDAKTAAAQEIGEELGIEVAADQLTDMTELAFARKGQGSGDGVPKGSYSSCGGQDEFLRFMLYVHQVQDLNIEDWNGKKTGLRQQGELIELKTVKLEDLWKEAACDMKALSAWALYEGLCRENKLG